MAADSVHRVFPVYILQRVVWEMYAKCKRAVPNETLGRLLGYRCSWQQNEYVKIVDWASGSLDSGRTHAYFTARGIRECELFLDEKYGTGADRPRELGLFHSHPFGCDPHFSSIDDQTFLTFPYDQEGNVFVLIDPLADFFKVYIISCQDGEKKLLQVPWVCYTPKVH